MIFIIDLRMKQATQISECECNETGEESRMRPLRQKRKTYWRRRLIAENVTHRLLAIMLAALLLLGCMPQVSLAATDDDSFIYGTSTEYSTYNKETSTLSDSYYFSDNWFTEDASKRNDALALISMQLTASTVEESADGNGGEFLEALGFEGVDFADGGTSDPYVCNYLYGKKTLADGTSLVAIVIQSYSETSAVKELGWKQNFIVNSVPGDGEQITSGEHYGFASAADNVIGDIKSMATRTQHTGSWAKAAAARLRT